MRFLGVLGSVALCALAFSPVAQAATDAGCPSRFCSHAGDGSFDVSGSHSRPGAKGLTGTSQGNGSGHPSDTTVERVWVLACPGNSPGVQDIDCTAAAAACAAPDERLYLAWARTVRRVDGTTLTPWRSSSTTMCIAPGRVPAAGGAAGAIDIAALVSSEFQRLPVPAPQPALQPAGRTLVNLATILYDTGPQTGQWDLTLVGTDVAVRAHPTQWRWSAPRGPVTTATTAGRPYPAKDVTITFTNPGATTLTLTTTWTGEFTVAGGAWQPIDGVVTRTATIPIDVVEARPQLVDSPRA